MAAKLTGVELFVAAAIVAAAGLVGLLAGVGPEYAIAASVGVVFVVIVLTDLAAGLATFTFLTFVALIPETGGPALNVVKAAGLILALAWFASMTTRQYQQGDLFRAQPALAATVLFFLAWVLLSQAWAADPGEARLTFSRITMNAIIFVIAFAAIRTRSDMTRVIAAFVLGAAFSMLYGVMQPPDASDPDRLAGTLGNANEMAAVLVVGGALSIGLAASLKDAPVKRLLAVVALFLCLAGLLLTLSRGGMVAGSVACVAAVIFAGRWRPQVTLAIVGLVICAVGFLTFAVDEQARQRIFASDGGTGRLDLWTVGVRMVEDRPVLGVGAGNFPTSTIDYLLEPGLLTRTEFIVSDPKVAHNTYLEMFAELGIIGFSLFLLVLLLCLTALYRAIRQFERTDNRQLELLARAVLVALLGLLAADVFQSAQFQKALWLLLALCPAFLALAYERDPDAMREGHKDGPAPTER